MDVLQRQPLGTQVQRHALAGTGAVGGLVLRVQAANAHRFAVWPQQQGIAHRDLAGQRRTGHHDPGPGHAEGPVDRQAKTTFGAALLHFTLGLQQLLAQGLDALPVTLDSAISGASA